MNPPLLTGGCNRTLENTLNACVDWLQVTFKDINDVHEIYTLLKLNSEDFTELDTGKYGYDSQMRFGHIAIYFNQYKNAMMGIHLELSGQGCREYEQYNKYGFDYLIPECFKHDINVTRLDLAVDDRIGYFTVSTLARTLKDGFVKSKFKKARTVTDHSISEGKELGKTLYFGSPSSDLQIRFYDKKEEMIAKGRDIGNVTAWVRSELQLRRENAFNAAHMLASGVELQQIILGILRNYITFCGRTKDTNKSRWKLAKYWEKFLNDVEKIKIAKEMPETSIEKSLDWFENSVTATFSLLVEAFGYDKELMLHWFEHGRDKRSKKHENMLNRFNAEKLLEKDRELQIKSKAFEKLMVNASFKDKKKKSTADNSQLQNMLKK